MNTLRFIKYYMPMARWLKRKTKKKKQKTYKSKFLSNAGREMRQIKFITRRSVNRQAIGKKQSDWAEAPQRESESARGAEQVKVDELARNEVVCVAKRWQHCYIIADI